MASNASDASNKKPDSISDALRILDDALETQSGPSVQEMASNGSGDSLGFSDLRTTLGSSLGGVMGSHSSSETAAPGSSISDKFSESVASFSQSLGSFRGQSAETLERMTGMASEFAGTAMVQGREISRRVDASVRTNPWPIIGGVAVGTFALGFLLGRSGGSKNTEL